MKGRILIDVPDTDLRCGQYVDIPKSLADGLTESGHFDPKAVDPAEPKPRQPRAKKAAR